MAGKAMVAATTRSGMAGWLGALFAFAIVAALALPISANAAHCPNEAIRTEQGPEVLALPDCMGLEMVSPPQKFNQYARFPAISADGNRVRFDSIAALAETPNLLHAFGDPYIATRTSSGWTSAPTTPPVPEMNFGWYENGTASAFSPDFSRWFHFSSTRSQMQAGEVQAYEGGLGGIFSPLSPLLRPVSGSILPRSMEFVVKNSTLSGASADLSHLYLQVGQGQLKETTAYLPGDPISTPDIELNSYIADLDSEGKPDVALLARDGAGKVWGGRCGAALGGAESKRSQGALSPDGARAYFSTRPDQADGTACDTTANKLRILKRVEGVQGVFIAPLFSAECSRVAPSCNPANGDDIYQGSSLDQSKVYFTTNRQLASSDMDSGSGCAIAASVGCDLYLYDADQPGGQRLIQVSAGEDLPGKHTAGSEAKAYASTVAISSDGSHVYFVAQGVLTDAANPEGAEAEADKPNLYLYERDSAHPNGQLAFVGILSSEDQSQLFGGSASAYVTPTLGETFSGGDGHMLTFASRASLTSSDDDGTRRDVFRYDADAGSLDCLSCLGASDSAAFDVVPRNDPPRISVPAFAEERRWVSEDGQSITFRTSEALVPEDLNGTVDAYLWREGSFYRIPGTPYANFSQGRGEDTPVLSLDGSEVAFQTFSQLLPQDGDTSPDVYVARIDGGFAQPSVAEPCLGENCQGSVAAPPSTPGAGSSTLTGVSNVKPKPVGCPKGKRKVKKKGKTRCVARHRKKSQSRRHNRHAGADRRAAK